MERKKYAHYNKIGEQYKLDISGKEIKKLVEKYITDYKKSKIQIECYEAILLLNDSFQIDKEKLIKYVKYIDMVIASISYQSKEIIENEYLSSNIDENWWREKYTRSTFFKVRQHAYIEFLSYVK